MTNLKVTLGAVNITEPILFSMREVSAPLAEVYSRLFNPAPASTVIFTSGPVKPINHYVDWWISNPSGQKLELLHTTEVDLSLIEEVAFKTLEFVVDRGISAESPYDPASNQTDYNNSDLVGATYIVFKPGIGPLSWNADIELIETGGFRYINGSVFESDERYSLLISTKSVFNAQVNNSGGFPNDYIDLISDRIFSASDYGKMIEADASVPVLTLTIDNMATIPEGTVFGVSNYKSGINSGVRYASISLPSGCYCMIGGKARQKIYIGKGEGAVFFKKGIELKVIEPASGWESVGRRVSQDGLPPLNGLPELGGWYVKAEYPRILEWYVEDLSPFEAVGGTDDVTPNASTRTKWVVGNLKFWAPDSGGYFDRYADPDADVDVEAGARTSGQTQADENKEHGHAAENMSRRGYPKDAGDRTTDYYFIDKGRDTGSNLKPLSISPSGGVEARPKNRTTFGYRLI